MTKLAIVTVDNNHHPDTGEWLASAKKLDTSGLDLLWLVVDNGSEVSVAETVINYPGVVWLQTGKNLGFVGGYNRGMRYAKEWGADFVLIINNDTLFGDNKILKNLLEVLNQNPAAGLVSPKIYFAPGFEFYKEKYSKKDTGKVIWYAGGEFDWNNVKSIHRGIDEVDTGKYDGIEKTGFISGCCLMVRREVLERVGYLDEKLFAYYEDDDWAERIKEAGFSQWYCGKSYIYHKVSRTSGIGSPMTDYLITRNRLWFGFKYANLRTKFALLREAIKQLISGRPDQKRGVMDFVNGVMGYSTPDLYEKCNWPFTLSIVILDYKSAKLTEALLKSIDYPAEIIVIDNTVENHDCAEMIKSFPHVKFVENKVNTLFTGGNNQGIAYSRGKYVLLLNSDIEVKPGALKELTETAEKLKDEAVLGGKLYFPDGTAQDSCFNLPTAWGAFREYFLKIPGSYFMYTPPGTGLTRVEVAVMACFLIPRRVIDRVGDLSHKLSYYFEDVEYCRRLKDADIPVYYVPRAKFTHHHGYSSKQAGKALSDERLIRGSKLYHSWFNYHLITAVLWAGQKFGRITSPKAKWLSE